MNILNRYINQYNDLGGILLTGTLTIAGTFP